MNNEFISNKKKENLINTIFKNYKPSQEFTFDDYSRLKLLTQITKLQELKIIDKLSEHKEVVINNDEIPAFKFLRSDSKCLKNDYTPKTNYGYKNRNKKFSTLFKKQINLNLFTQNKKSKIITDDIFPNDFDEINEQIELREIENVSNLNRYFNNENKNILNNIIDISHLKNKTKRAQSMTTKNKKSFYEKSFTEPNLNYDKGKIKRKSEISRPIQSSRGIKLNQNKNIVNLKLGNQNIHSRNSTNYNLSNYTTSYISFCKPPSGKIKYKNKFKMIEKKVLNRNSFYITRNNNKLINNTNRTESSEFKSSKYLINRIINDGYVIDKYITSNRLQLKKSKNKIDKESILLQLEARLKAKKHHKVKKLEKKGVLNDEEFFTKKLSLIPDFAKKFFRDIYNRIMFENRVLNKNEDYNIKSEIEKLDRKKKLRQQIKKAAIQRMRITKDNLITEKDDKIVIGEQRKEYDFYGNLDGLEWLMMKRNIINYGKKYH